MLVLSLGLGVFIGYIIVEEVELEEAGTEVKDLVQRIINKVKGEELVIIEGLNLGNLELVKDEYNGDYYYIVVREEFPEVNYLIKRKMLPYYKLMVSALKKEDYEKRPKDDVRLLVVSEDNSSYIGMELSRERMDSMDRTFGDVFPDKHFKERGWDVLNNIDMFWISDDLKELLEEDLKDRINWELEREE